MERIQGIIDAMNNLSAQQAAGSQAIADQITVVANEIAQLHAGSITQEQLDALEAQLREAASIAEQQAAQIRATSQDIAGMVPDELPPA